MAYDAFISYSHAADGLLAPRLQDGLQRFAKPWWRRRSLRVFRDQTGLSVNPSLWASITAALDDSHYFVILASPEARESEWVNREIEYWRTHKDPALILPVLTDGELVWDPVAQDLDMTASTAVPAALAGAFLEEPRHMDMRWARGDEQLDLRNGRFRDEVAELAAPMHGLAKDELAGADVRQHRRTIRTAFAAAIALVLLSVASAGAAFAALHNADRARRNETAAVLARSEADRQSELATSKAAEAKQRKAEADANAARAQLNAQHAATEQQNAEASAAEADRQRTQANASAARALTEQGKAEQSAAEARASQTKAEQNAAAASAAQQQAQEAAAAATAADQAAQQANVDLNAANADLAAANADLTAANASLEAQNLDSDAMALKDTHLDLALLLAAKAEQIGGPDDAAARVTLLDLTQEANHGVDHFLPLPAGMGGIGNFQVLATTSDGRRAAAFDGAEIVVWDFASDGSVSGVKLIPWDHPGESITTAGRLSTYFSFVNGNGRLLEAGTNVATHLYDVDTGTERVDLLPAAPKDSMVAVNRDATSPYSLAMDQTSNELWSVDSANATHGMLWHAQASGTDAVVGHLATIYSYDLGSWAVLDLATDQLHTLYQPVEASSVAMLTPDGQRVVGVVGGHLLSFDAATGAPLSSIDLGLAGYPTDVQVSPSGTEVAVQDGSGAVTLVNLVERDAQSGRTRRMRRLLEVRSGWQVAGRLRELQRWRMEGQPAVPL